MKSTINPNIFSVSHAELSQEGYEKEIEVIAESHGFKKNDLQIEYTWRAVIIFTKFGGCDAAVMISQSATNDPTAFESLKQRPMGDVRAYIKTPNAFYSGNGLQLDHFDGESAASKEFMKTFDPNNTSHEDMVKMIDEVYNKSFDAFGRWYLAKIEELSK